MADALITRSPAGDPGSPATSLADGDNLPVAPPRRRQRWRAGLGRRPAGMVALAVLVALYLIAFGGPLIYRVSPTDANALATNLPVGDAHPLGTDELGRDELARLLAGGRLSLTLGVFAVMITICLGTAVGLLAGFYRRATEMVLMRFVDAAMAIPAFFLVLIEITVFGNTPAVIIAVIGFTYWPQVARLVHGETLALREREFVEASIALGASRLRLMARHILPHLFPSMLVMATLAVAWAILTESALSFLGLGIQPPDASWGSLLQNAQTYVFLDPALAIFPGLCIAVTVLAFNILGDTLRDVL
jgi:peptide/nickel transport system permease protein